MKNIFKSFFKTYLKNWYQFLAFIIFIVISSALTIGFVSNSLQIATVAMRIENQETKWDYEFGTGFSDYENQFVYNFCQNENGITNDLNEKLINLEAIVNIQIDEKNFEKLKDYLQYAFDNYQKDFFDNYELYIGQFIKENIFSFSYLYSHKILLPKYEVNASKIIVDFFTIINEKWKNIIPQYYGQMQNYFDEYLVKKYNLSYPNNKIFIDHNWQIQYSWNNPQLGNIKINYHLEPINLNYSNNVVSTLSSQRLTKMNNDEVLVNDKFAQTHNLKIGDTIKIINAKMKKGDANEMPFQKEYRIIGYGIKSNNLFTINGLTNNPTVEDNNAFIYLTNKEIENYLKYFWFYDNRWILPNDTEQILEELPTISDRLRIKDKNNLNKFNNFISYEMQARKELFITSSYNKLPFVVTLKVYLIQSIILTLIGIFALLLSLGFVNFCIKKELKQIASQLGLFKSMGYKNFEIASALWIRTLLTLILGFIFGYLVSLPIQIFVNHILVTNFSVVIQEIWTNFLFLTTIFCFVPICLALINLYSITHYLSINSLLMIQITGGSNFSTNENNYLKWYKNKIEFKNFPLIKPFSIKKITNLLLIPLFFIIASLIILFQFNIKTLMVDLTNTNRQIYNNNIDHLFDLSKRLDWYFNVEDNKYYLKDADQYNLKTSQYNDLNDLIQKQDPQFNQFLNDYFVIERIQTNKNQILVSLLKIIETNINYQVFNFQDFEKLLTQVVEDYELLFQDDFPNLQPTITLVKEQWVENLIQLNKRLSTRQIQITFNNIFFKSNIDFPILKMTLLNEGYQKFNSPENWTLNLLNDYNQKVFLLDHYQLLKKDSVLLSEPRTIPVLITNHFAKFNGIKIGQRFKAQISPTHDDSDIYLKVVGIEQKDNVTNNIYSSEYFWKKLNGSQIPFPLFNSFFSKNQLFNFINKKNDFKIQTDYFNFYFPSLNENFTLGDVFANPENLADFINWNNINGKNFKSLSLENRVSQQKNREFSQLINILLLFTFIVLFTLLIIITIISSLDYKNEIIILKAFGYTNNWINFKLLKKYLIAMLIGFTGAVLIAYFFWKFIVGLLFNKLSILVHNPFTYLPIVILATFIIIFFIICWSLSRFIIKKTKPLPQ